MVRLALRSIVFPVYMLRIYGNFLVCSSFFLYAEHVAHLVSPLCSYIYVLYSVYVGQIWNSPLIIYSL
jgi:hypothetical protein